MSGVIDCTCKRNLVNIYNEIVEERNKKKDKIIEIKDALYLKEEDINIKKYIDKYKLDQCCILILLGREDIIERLRGFKPK